MLVLQGRLGHGVQTCLCEERGPQTAGGGVRGTVLRGAVSYIRGRKLDHYLSSPSIFIEGLGREEVGAGYETSHNAVG